MYKVLTLNKISKVGLAELPADLYSVADEEKNPDAVLLRSFKMHDMELPESLLAVARCGAGVNNIPLDKCAEKGIVVFNTPGANANAVKELVLTALLISSRKITESCNWAQSLKGSEGISAAVEKGKSRFAGPEISGKTLGIIGLGAIGVLVAEAAVSLGMKVIGYDPYLSLNGALKLDKAVKYTTNLDDIYANGDYITVHVPLTPDTREMLRKESFAKMKDGVRIINLARGELVNITDIKAAINEGKVAEFVTDFPNEDNVGVDGIITLPHLGASTPEAEDNCAAMAANEMREYLENGNIVNSVNYPNCFLAKNAKTRVCVLYKNSSDAVSHITKVFADNGITVKDMASKSKGDFAYSVIDFDNDADSALLSAVEAIDGVIRVRSLY